MLTELQGPALPCCSFGRHFFGGHLQPQEPNLQHLGLQFWNSDLTSRANAGDLQHGPFPSALPHYLHLPAQGTFGELTASTGLISPLPLFHPFPQRNPVLFFSEMLPSLSTTGRLRLSPQTIFNIPKNVYFQQIYTLLLLQLSISCIFPKFFS